MGSRSVRAAHPAQRILLASSDCIAAVGISGGPDSMSLTVLLNRWAKKAGVRLVGITIDHRFREESAIEAKVPFPRMRALRPHSELSSSPSG